ncbi:hypothetical protein PRZ48_004655 [Zasmidium cellare]|uniref:RING-type domain-containing protein n=1 Tax=Zasmidium cellare TaxID=395010 RepID=A0ABR0ER54_ZASCE|nr:hypothetical protein PRZ48_004655 [Zasmidium cellare]
MSSQTANPWTTTMVSVNLFELPSPQQDCPICRLDFVDAVVLPCHADHQFCRSCIVAWLDQNASDPSCPTCRAAYVASVEVPDLNLLQQVQLALRIISLQLPKDRDEPTSMDTLGLEAGVGSFTNGQIRDTATLAARYLAWRDSPQKSQDKPIKGVGFFDAKKLLLHLFVMARLLKAFAAVQHNGFTDIDISDWELIVKYIGKAISSRRGKSQDVATFRRRLRRRIDFDKSTRALEFLAEPWTSTLVDQLLDYVVFVAWKDGKERHVRRHSQKVGKKATKAARHGVVARKGCKLM